MISRQEIKEKLQQLLDNANGESERDLALQEYFKYLQENYGHFDKEAREEADGVFARLLDVSKKAIAEMPEGQEKEKFLRMLDIASGKRYDSKLVIQILERRATEDSEILKDTRENFERGLQNLLDLISDISGKRHRGGIAGFAKLGLFAMAVDELLAAFHLAQHAFVNQAYSHIRTIFEVLDKIVLFHLHPEWVTLWSSEKSEDKKRILKELSPSSVRKKLDKQPYDEGYAFFSELGPHGTWGAVKSRSSKRVGRDSRKRPTFHIQMGGTPFKSQRIWANCFLLFALSYVLLKFTEIYAEQLDKKKSDGILIQTAHDLKNFLSKHFVAWAGEAGLDTKELIDFFNGPAWKFLKAIDQE